LNPSSRFRIGLLLVIVVGLIVVLSVLVLNPPSKALTGEAPGPIEPKKDNCRLMGVPGGNPQWVCTDNNPTAYCPKCD
jgi:hypothetical protein